MPANSGAAVGSFLGPKLKVERAKRHINELEDTLAAYAGRHPYALVGEVDPETQQSRVRVRIREPVPEEVATIAGDAVHNLRSAIDILVCDLAALTGDTSRKARFPFWKDAAGEKHAMKKLGATLDAGLWQAIHALKPYPGGNDLLRALHDLDVIDKHQLIIAANSHASIARQKFGGEVACHVEPRIVQDGDIIHVGASPADIEPQKDPAGTFDVAFGDGMPMAGKPIPGALVDMTNMVQEIIEGFERYCLARGLI